MHDLIVLPAALPGSLTTSEIQSTMDYAENEKAASTRACYQRDFRDFSIWCMARGASPCPAHPGIVGAYLSSLADGGRKASTIGRRVASISYHHKIAGHEPPTNSEAVKAVVRGIRRTIGTATEQKSPITGELVMQMLKAAPDTLRGKRDRALIAFGMLSAMRRSELCALMVEDLVEVPDGLRVIIRRSKTDPTGEGQEIAIPRGAKIRPVETLQTWLAAANITTGPVFRAVVGNDTVSDQPLRVESLARAVKAMCRRVGLDPATYSGHSLRSGFVTSAVEANASLVRIAEQTRHKSLDMIRVYSRRADLFRDHASASFG